PPPWDFFGILFALWGISARKRALAPPAVHRFPALRKGAARRELLQSPHPATLPVPLDACRRIVTIRRPCWSMMFVVLFLDRGFRSWLPRSQAISPALQPSAPSADSIASFPPCFLDSPWAWACFTLLTWPCPPTPSPGATCCIRPSASRW